MPNNQIFGETVDSPDPQALTAWGCGSTGERLNGIEKVRGSIPLSSILVAGGD